MTKKAKGGFSHIQAQQSLENKEDDWYDNDVTLIWKDFDFFKPLAGIEKYRYMEEAETDVKAAEMMAKIYDDIRRYNDVNDKEQVYNQNVFMTRLLFCFFAENTGLFPIAGMFTAAIKEETKSDGSDLKEFLDDIFGIMAIEDKQIRASLPNKTTQFPYINDRLFKANIPTPTISKRTRTLILQCGEYNWAEINPDIFGSMIQAVINPCDRANLGIHYTSVPNIMKVIRPLFLDELTGEFARAKEEVKRLNTLMARLAKIKFFDPACGSGNFLVTAYKSIKELEMKIWKRLSELGSAQQPFSKISLTQFYGIEIDEYACNTARLSLWLAEHQANICFRKELGSKVDTPPLGNCDNIVCGNSCRMDWNTVCPHNADEEVYVIGNPPYLGSSMQDSEQKKDMACVCGTFESYKNLDYISCWFAKGAEYIKNSMAKLAFVSTNSICQGEQVSMLWKPILEADIEIAFAYKSFKWSNNAKNNAAVIVVILGLQNKNNKEKLLYSDNTVQKVKHISPYLLPNIKAIVGRTTYPISDFFPLMTRGSMPSDGGFLIMSEEEKQQMLEEYPQTAAIIKGYTGAEEFLNSFSRYCLWMNEEDYRTYGEIPPIKERIEGVRLMRLASNTTSTQEYAKYPYMFRQPQYVESESIIVPSTSSERREYIPIGFLGKDVVVSNLAYVVYRAELWLFAILTSKMHNIWTRTVGGRLKSDYRYTNTLCYNTFPFPKITEKQKEKLSVLAKEVLLTREKHTGMTLGEMYYRETMPQDLKEAHRALDTAVEQFYRMEPFTSDDERFEYLFRQYDIMTKKK